MLLSYHHPGLAESILKNVPGRNEDQGPFRDITVALSERSKYNRGCRPRPTSEVAVPQLLDLS